MVLSCIIPSFTDHLFPKTVTSILESAVGDIEVIPVMDGWVCYDLPKDPRVKPIVLPVNKGMRNAVNAGLAVATGDYIMKSDAHCLYAKGYDKELVESCADDWLVIPRRYALFEETFTRQENRPIYDYHYLSYPSEEGGHYGYDMPIVPCNKHTVKHMDILIDDTMIFQGSCYVANRKYFMEHVGFLDDRWETYGSFACEPSEVGLKYWLGGGQVKVNKNTWYAHLKKRQFHYDQGIYNKNFKVSPRTQAGHTWATKHWMGNEEPNMIHKFSWLVEKFWPLPTWPENYKEIC